ncbi:MAG: ACT domain-containing protein [Blastocatellia bacterium AA13]|nr:MAG: ACT domain-containing protein [Blastocatellia bacterium AA13]
MTLSILDGLFSICRLEERPGIPDWVTHGHFFSVTLDDGELSVVCREENVPSDTRQDQGWKCLELEGPLDFTITGIMAAITNPLADAGVSIFVISTYKTEYIMVKEDDLEKATLALTQQGHLVNS